MPELAALPNTDEFYLVLRNRAVWSKEKIPVQGLVDRGFTVTESRLDCADGTVWGDGRNVASLFVSKERAMAFIQMAV